MIIQISQLLQKKDHTHIFVARALADEFLNNEPPALSYFDGADFVSDANKRKALAFLDNARGVAVYGGSAVSASPLLLAYYRHSVRLFTCSSATECEKGELVWELQAAIDAGSNDTLAELPFVERAEFWPALDIKQTLAITVELSNMTMPIFLGVQIKK